MFGLILYVSTRMDALAIGLPPLRCGKTGWGDEAPLDEAPKALPPRRRRRRRGGEMGRGYPPPHPTRGSWGAS